MAEFKLPDCWKDDERMNAFFQPFRPKQINPHHYESKLLFWQDLILKYCKYKKGDPTFNRKELQLEFRRNGRKPLCLETVVSEMLAQKLIQKREELLNNPYNTWTMWAINNFVKSPVRWGVQKFLGNLDANSEETNFCHIPALQEMSDKLLEILMENPGKVLRLDELKMILKSKMHFNDVGLNICLFHLFQKNKIYVEFDIIQNDINVNLIKIPGKDENKENRITEEDRSMIKLQETKTILSNQIDDIEKDIMRYQELARKCVREKNQRMAKLHLKRKNLLQDKCDKKSNILHNIETLITNMEDAQSHGEILNAYKYGSDSLKSLMSKSGLTIENVDEIMSTIKEISEENDEIQHSLANTDNAGIANFDDDALENELKNILGESTVTVAPIKFQINPEPTNEREKEILENELIEILEKLEVETSTPNSSIQPESSTAA